MLNTPRSINFIGQNSTQIDSSKYNKNFKDTDELFSNHIDKTVFDSIHSYSKYSSLGGTHTMEKKRRKLKNTGSFKKKRSKPASSKKHEKGRSSSSGKFQDQIVIKNYKSANLTSNPVKIANVKEMEQNQKRYQYHKRIRSDTGNTLMNPFEQIYDRATAVKSKLANPHSQKAKTDLSTPAITNEDQRHSVLESKLPANYISNPTTIQVNKYEFKPSFTHHKTVTLESNSQYRKFKANMNPSKGAKIDMSKIKKAEKNKKKEKRAGGGSYSQTPSKTHARKISKTKSLNHENHPYNYSPQQPDSLKLGNEIDISEIEEDPGVNEEGVFEYY